MRKERKRIYDKFINHGLPLKKRLFNLIFSATFVVTLGGIAGSIATKTDWIGVAVIGIIAGLTLACLIIANLRDSFEECAAVMGALVNLLFLPIVFFWTGGIDSGMNLWFLGGLVFLFLMLEGKIFHVLLSLSILSFSLCYIVSYYHPEYVHYLSSPQDKFLDTYVTMLMLSIVLGILLKFQNHIYWEERDTIQKQQDELQKANETKSRFLANMSHEIRTPINTIIGLNEINLREEISEDVEENCVNIQKASKMLLSLVNDILDMSKIEAGKMEIIEREYELGEMLSELIHFHWIRAHDKKLDFRIDIASDIPNFLRGDDIRIKQILMNLITNAIKYTEQGSVTLEVRGEKIDTDRVRIRYAIKDTGIGIRAEDMPYLFEYFKRMDGKRNGDIEGTGLGLAITRQLVQLMGGTLTVDSIYQRGSAFTIELEQKVIDATPIGNIKQILHPDGAEKNSYHQSFEAPKGRVLIVDDNEMNRLVAVKLLRATKVQVDVAENGQRCLELTKKHFYHVIFMDHMMAGLDGVETLRRLRKQVDGRCRHTPVVMLTANATSGADKLYERKGFDGYLVKPIDSALLEATILKFMPREYITFWKNREGSADIPEAFGEQKKKALSITTESICNLPQSLREKYDIEVIPYYIKTEYGKFQDEVEVSGQNMIEYLTKGGNAEVLPPNIRDCEEFFAEALENSRQVLHIGRKGKEDAKESMVKKVAKGFDNVIVWTPDASVEATEILTLYAVNMAEQGKELKEIIKELERLQQQIVTTSILPKKASPEIWSKAWEKQIKKVFAGKNKIDQQTLLIHYAGCSFQMRQQIMEEIERYLQFDKIFEYPDSAAMICEKGCQDIRLTYVRQTAGTQAKGWGQP